MTDLLQTGHHVPIPAVVESASQQTDAPAASGPSSMVRQNSGEHLVWHVKIVTVGLLRVNLQFATQGVFADGAANLRRRAAPPAREPCDGPGHREC